MQLGCVGAILADLTLEEVLAYAADEGFRCVERICWPPAQAERRYAGVCHVEVRAYTDEAAQRVREMLHIHRVAKSGLGYYPKPLDPDPAHRAAIAAHLRKVIAAAA